MTELISYHELSINHTLWIKPGGFASIGTEAAPDPQKKPPTLVTDGSLQVGGGAAITSFSTDASFSDSGNAVVPTQLAVQIFVTNALAAKAPLAGSKTRDFSAQNLRVSGSLAVDRALTVSQSLSVGEAFRADGPVELFGTLTEVATLWFQYGYTEYSATATSDGFVSTVTTFTPEASFSVSKLVLESPEGSERAWVPITGSLCVPVRKGDTWKIYIENVPYSQGYFAHVTWLGLGLKSTSGGN